MSSVPDNFSFFKTAPTQQENTVTAANDRNQEANNGTLNGLSVASLSDGTQRVQNEHNRIPVPSIPNMAPMPQQQGIVQRRSRQSTNVCQTSRGVTASAGQQAKPVNIGVNGQQQAKKTKDAVRAILDNMDSDKLRKLEDELRNDGTRGKAEKDAFLAVIEKQQAILARTNNK